MEDRILTIHPEGKKGVNILKNKYEQVKDTLITIVEEKGEISFTDLTEQAKQRLAGKFDGKITWYVVTVKLDLEARGILQRVPKTNPQKLQLQFKREKTECP